MTRQQLLKELRRGLIAALIYGSVGGFCFVMMLRYMPMASRSCGTHYYPDGSTAEFEMTQVNYQSAQKKTGKVYYTYYDANHEKQWEAELTGSFLYDGVSSVCTDADSSVEVQDPVWNVLDQQAWTQGNTALGCVEMERTMLGVRTAIETLEMQLTCDANGNLS